MWKRAALLALCFILVCTPVANAAEQRALVAQPTLSFSGKTATCGCNVSDLGKSLQVTMELWDGSSLIDSWYKTGTSKVMMSETCTVTRGRDYTLSVSVMINGVNYGPYSITRQCP